MMLLLTVVAALARATCPVAALPPIHAAHRPSHLGFGRFYALSLCIGTEDSSIAGIARLTFDEVTGPSLNLFLVPSLHVASVEGTGVRRWTRRADTLAIERDTDATAPLIIEVHYSGHPDTSVVRFTADSSGATAATYGLPYSARGWWPTPGSTLAKADSAEIQLTVRSSLSAISNGRMTSRHGTQPGWSTVRWVTRHPIYPDVMSFAVARYVETRASARLAHGSTPLLLAFFAADTEKAYHDVERLPRILTFYDSVLGPYPFADEKYGIAEFAIQSFREHQTIPSLGPKYLTGDRRNEWIIAHELAQQWFGNSLSVRTWRDAWLNEGLATYAAALWKEHADGRPAYDSVMARYRERRFQGTIAVADSADLDHMFTGTTFFKGALLLDALRTALGDTAFFTALREYVSRHAYALVDTQDLETVMERACGGPLIAFFSRWLNDADSTVASMSPASCHAAGR